MFIFILEHGDLFIQYENVFGHRFSMRMFLHFPFYFSSKFGLTHIHLIAILAFWVNSVFSV